MHLQSTASREDAPVDFKLNIPSSEPGFGDFIALGYRTREIESLATRPVADEAATINFTAEPRVERRPVARSTGCPLRGALLPHADDNDPESLEDGYNKRMGAVLPPVLPFIRKGFLRGLKRHVKKMIRKFGFKPIRVDKIWDMEEYLSHTNYPEWRKEELRKYKDEITYLLERNEHGELIHFIIKLFMKDEHYVDYKYPRGIYAREDAAKLTFGPWFKMMEDIVYSRKEFIKHVPVKNRPNFIMRKLYREGARYVATDYSSYEAHFAAVLMESCEFVLYKFLLSEVSGGMEVYEVMREVLQGKNKIVNKFIRGVVKARRMSGEMNTSLGNGWSNLMFMTYISKLNGCKILGGVVEGDDGLFSFSGKCPTTEDFTKYGFSIKLEVYTDLAKAGFCGQLFDVQDLQVVTDPRKVTALFGWTSGKYFKSRRGKLLTLLRCKALSMAHQYPGCPIIGALAQYGLRMTRSYDVRQFIARRRDLSLYEYERLMEAVNDKDALIYVEPGEGTRLLFEELYDISVEEQIEIENYLNGLNVLQPLEIPLLMESCPSSWQHYWDEYVQPYIPSEYERTVFTAVEYPDFRWDQVYSPRVA